MVATRTRHILVVLALVTAGAVRLTAASPTLTPEQQAHFLLTARIVAHKGIPKGVTAPVRVTLTDGVTTHDAAFSTIDQHEQIMHFSNGRTELNFVDSYKYSVAAYRLAVLLGLSDMMPVTVEREIDHHKGSLSWWVDDVRMDEGQRVKQHLLPPDPQAWNRQMYNMRIFSQLVADTDRNFGNLLITSDWKIVMIDFTRAFRDTKKLLDTREVTACDRRLLDRLKTLTEGEVAQRTKGYLEKAEIRALLARRDAIATLIADQVAKNGEGRVLF
jgi:hypothetical protein